MNRDEEANVGKTIFGIGEKSGEDNQLRKRMEFWRAVMAGGKDLGLK